jgi:hypothetical protein
MNAPATATAAKKPEGEMVRMVDDRIVEFAGKRKLLKESFVAADGRVQTRLDFRNGESRLFTVPESLLAKFAGHGAEQKLGDEIAGLDDVDDCVIAVDELIERLYNGEWGIKREANGLAGTSALLKALIELSGKPREEVAALLKTKTQAEKMALRANAKVKVIIDRIEAEKTKGSKVDTEAILSQLIRATSPDAPSESD